MVQDHTCHHRPAMPVMQRCLLPTLLLLLVMCMRLSTLAATPPGLKPGSTFSYRTLFRPDSLAIDTFYSPLITRQF